MAPSAAIDIPASRQDQNIVHSLDSVADEVFSPSDSLSTSVSSISIDEDLLSAPSEQGKNSPPDSDSAIPLPTSSIDEVQFALGNNVGEAIAFGRGPDAWLYHPESGVFDLSRQSEQRIHIPTESDNMTGLLVDPARTILVIVDMQNFFIHPACHSHATGVAAVEPILKTVTKCRMLGIQVSFLNWVIEEKDMFEMPPAVQRGWSLDRLRTHGVGWNINLGSELPNAQGRCLWRNSWNAELYPPIKEASRPEDAVFLKNRPSGMWSDHCDMAKYLRDNNLKTILFAGVNSDQCVLGTLTDSYSKSYDCIMISDCVGTATTGLMAQELVEFNVSRNYGFVVDSQCMMESRRT